MNWSIFYLLVLIKKLFKDGNLFEDLEFHAKSSKFLNTNRIIKIFNGICSGLNFIHDSNLAHRDLKPQNILLENNKQEAILTDFGSMTEKNINIVDSKKCQEIEDWSSTNCSMFYRAPELFSPKVGTVINEKADIWSLGCLLYTIMFNKGPFDYVTEKGWFLKLIL